MNTYPSTFQRVEKKYLLTEQQYLSFFEDISVRLSPDQYGESTVLSVYFDTPDHRLIRASLEKPPYKEKLRLRSYGVPEETAPVFIELKKKYRGVVYKRRVSLPLAEAERYLCHGAPPPTPSQITNEIDRFLDYYPNLSPAMLLSYDRSAFFEKENPSLRITFDRHILWREEKLSLKDGIWGNTLLPENRRLMEIKIPGALPLWLAHALDSSKIYPASFSKYGTAYLLSAPSRQPKQKGGFICA